MSTDPHPGKSRRRSRASGSSRNPAPMTRQQNAGSSGSADDDEDAPGCDDPYAALDITAFEEGDLSPERIQRLARHVKQCLTCRILVAWIVVESVPAKGTGVHAAVPVSAAAAPARFRPESSK